MSDINQVKLRGRAGGDAEVKTLPNSTLVTVRIATGNSYTDRSGSKVDRTDWHLVACWGKVAEQATGIRKGDVVTVALHIKPVFAAIKCAGVRINVQDVRRAAS